MLDGCGHQQVVAVAVAVTVGVRGGVVEDVVAEVGNGRAEPPVLGRTDRPGPGDPYVLLPGSEATRFSRRGSNIVIVYRAARTCPS